MSGFESQAYHKLIVGLDWRKLQFPHQKMGESYVSCLLLRGIIRLNYGFDKQFFSTYYRPGNVLGAELQV